MTTPRMTDERLAEFARCRSLLSAPARRIVGDLLAEVRRTRTFSEEVKAAMVRWTAIPSAYVQTFKMIGGGPDTCLVDWEKKGADQATLAAAFVAMAQPGKEDE